MTVSAHTFRRLVSLAGFAAVVAALAVPTALARPVTEGGDVNYRTQIALDLRSPDTLEVTTQALRGVDPAIATAIAGHQHLQVAGDLRSPDTREATAQVLGGGDPAIATAIAGHQLLQVAGDHRSPDTRDVTVNPITRDSPVAAAAASDRTNWGLVAAMFVAIGILLAGVGALGMQGYGKRHGSVNPA